MAIELDTTRIAAQTPAIATQNEAPAAQTEKSTSVLGGENLKVTSGAMSDLEKLVARLKTETDDTKMSVTQRRISVLTTVLDSMSDRITAAERESFIEIAKLDGEKTDLEGKLAVLESDKATVEGRISELDLKIAELESAIERAVQEGKDHRESVEELKRLREEEQAKLDRIDTAIASVNSKISGIDVKIAECTKTIAQTTLNEVANALRIAARDADATSSSPDVADESNADRVKKDAKEAATDIGNVIRESLDKIDDQMRDTLDESQPVRA